MNRVIKKYICTCITISIVLFVFSCRNGNLNKSNEQTDAETATQIIDEELFTIGYVYQDNLFISFMQLKRIDDKFYFVEQNYKDIDNVAITKLYNIFDESAKPINVIGDKWEKDPLENIDRHILEIDDNKDSSRMFLSDKLINYKIIKIDEKNLYKFYKEFTRDKWGKHVVNWDMLKDVGSIAEKTGVEVQFISDIDKDYNLEYWVYYNTAERVEGRVVYELQDTLLTMISSECFQCAD